MSYGVYSQVYYAENYKDPTKIKIGETTNVSRRGNQLMKEDYIIMAHANVPDNYAARLFIEAYLRAKISYCKETTSIKTDYFICSIETKAQISHNFYSWVSEAIAILNAMPINIQENALSKAKADFFEKHKVLLQLIYEGNVMTEKERMTEFVLREYIQEFQHYCPDIIISTKRSRAWVTLTYRKI